MMLQWGNTTQAVRIDQPGVEGYGYARMQPGQDTNLSVTAWYRPRRE